MLRLHTKNRFFVTVLGLILITTGKIFGQDIQLSQFYANPLLLNAGFAGSAHSDRVIAHHRIQWPGLSAKYTTSLLSYDRYWDKYNSGFGVIATQDFRGNSTINSTSIDFSYSYELHLSNSLTFRPGLQVGFSTRNLDYTRLTFPSMFDDTGKISDSPLTSFTDGRVFYTDVGAGSILYTNKLWIGVSALHLNTPNLTVMNKDDELPVKWTFIAGYKIDFVNQESSKSTIGYDKEAYITPTLHYKAQGKFDQMDLGVYGGYDILVAGLWYRGLPFKSFKEDRFEVDFENDESLVFIIGAKLSPWTITYSYDLTLSALREVNPYGSHELNLTYVHQKFYKRKRPMKRLPCPKFFNY